MCRSTPAGGADTRYGGINNTPSQPAAAAIATPSRATFGPPPTPANTGTRPLTTLLAVLTTACHSATLDKLVRRAALPHDATQLRVHRDSRRERRPDLAVVRPTVDDQGIGSRTWRVGAGLARHVDTREGRRDLRIRAGVQGDPPIRS